MFASLRDFLHPASWGGSLGQVFHDLQLANRRPGGLQIGRVRANAESSWRSGMGAHSLLKSQSERAFDAGSRPRALLAPKRAFPNAQDTPAGFAQRARLESVALCVGHKLCLPEYSVVRGRARMSRAGMPEAAVHKHGESTRRLRLGYEILTAPRDGPDLDGRAADSPSG